MCATGSASEIANLLKMADPAKRRRSECTPGTLLSSLAEKCFPSAACSCESVSPPDIIPAGSFWRLDFRKAACTSSGLWTLASSLFATWIYGDGLTPHMKLRVGLIGLGEAWETRYRPA